jgi:hypothetical protein
MGQTEEGEETEGKRSERCTTTLGHAYLRRYVLVRNPLYPVHPVPGMGVGEGVGPAHIGKLCSFP